MENTAFLISLAIVAVCTILAVLYDRASFKRWERADHVEKEHGPT